MDFRDFADAATDSLEAQRSAWEDLVFHHGTETPVQDDPLLHLSNWKRYFAEANPEANKPLKAEVQDWDFAATDDLARLELTDNEKELVEDFERLPTFLVAVFARFPAFRSWLAQLRAQVGLERTRCYVWEVWLDVVTRPRRDEIIQLRCILYSEYVPLKQAKPLFRALWNAGKTPGEVARIMAPVVYKLAKDLKKTVWDAGPDGLYEIRTKTYEKDNTYIHLKHTTACSDYENYDVGVTSSEHDLATRSCSNTYVSSLLEDGMTFAGLLHMDSSMIHFEGLLLVGEIKVCKLWFNCVSNFLNHVNRLLKHPSLLPEEIDLQTFQAHLKDVVPELQAHHHLLQHVPRIEEDAFILLEEGEMRTKMGHSRRWHMRLRNNIHTPEISSSGEVLPSVKQTDTIHILPPAAMRIQSRLRSKHDHYRSQLNVIIAENKPCWSEDVELSMAGEPISRKRVRKFQPGPINEPVCPSALLPDLQGRRMLVEDVNKLACWLAHTNGEASPETGIEQHGAISVVVLHEG